MDPSPLPSWEELLLTIPRPTPPLKTHILYSIYSIKIHDKLFKSIRSIPIVLVLLLLYLQIKMRMMIDLGSQTGPLHINIMDTATSVECGREVRFRRSFRSLVECMVPCCGFQPTDDDSVSGETESIHCSSSTVTGTFFGYRKGRVSFCLQEDTRSSPLLLLEFAVPTAYLAKEMEYGVLRIALECDKKKEIRCGSLNSGSCSLYNVPVWSMYCNGRKVGFAIRRQMSVNDAAVLKLMQSVSVGAGVLPFAPKSSEEDGELMYLRASFERVIGSPDSESFHMLNPVGSTGQELSIFLLRS